MANKSNIRSIRFTDELYELIDRQAGDTFTQKLENLVTRCSCAGSSSPANELVLQRQCNTSFRSRRPNLQKL